MVVLVHRGAECSIPVCKAVESVTSVDLVSHICDVVKDTANQTNCAHRSGVNLLDFKSQFTSRMSKVS